ncbi:hypothetical protein GDO81_028729 [Engystomops pustulosus]|uniref:Uncharacterized protein n=1 Tax=Engystomops pustulosus TaxID=76066 RepID=A0AAV6YNJ4_ENGPU|nr:hypothetical protein GDO81_028729 [Engystomops pustulosus]
MSASLGFLGGGSFCVADATDAVTLSSIKDFNSSMKETFSDRINSSIHGLHIGFTYDSGKTWRHILHFLAGVLLLIERSDLLDFSDLSGLSSLPFPLDPCSLS